MSSETIEVKKREQVGSLASRKLRLAGQVPANLYGHGEQNVNLSVRADAISRIIHHGTKLLSLTGAVTDTALLREVQWDTFGIDVIHVDLTRVSTSEAVEVTLPIELHGEAPGTSHGGQLSVALHEVTILCPASKIPDHIHVNVGKLQLGEAIHASEISLPEGATMITPASDVVVHVVKPAGGGEEDADALGAEPELIRKKESEDSES